MREIIENKTFDMERALYNSDAIADYILNGGPDTVLSHLFLCHTGQIRPLKARSGSRMISRYMKGRAFHAFRRNGRPPNSIGERFTRTKVSSISASSASRPLTSQTVHSISVRPSSFAASRR